MPDDYDEILTRLHDTGPEFGGWLSNHGPMAADALLQLPTSVSAHRWVDRYLPALDERPRARWPIDPAAWRDPLGDPSRLGDWISFFERQLAAQPWPEVVSSWWPRLLPGAIAAATHPLIRTGHVVRRLREEATPARLRELAHALGYWAARWAPLPRTRPGPVPPATAFDRLPAVGVRGGARTRLAQLSVGSRWPSAASTTWPPAPMVAFALDDLVDTAVERYADWAPAAPTMLVHMATAPRAAGLVLPSLPPDLWRMTYRFAWATSAAIASMYKPRDPGPRPAIRADLHVAGVAQHAADTGDEHAIKFTEVALESHRRGNPAALTAAHLAARFAESPRP